MRRRLTARGSVAPAVAWDRYADPARWTEWAPHLGAVEASAARLEPGMTGRVLSLGGLARARFDVLDVDHEHRCWSWLVASGPVTLRLEHRVDATDDGAATTLVLHGPAVVVLPYLPLAFWAIRRLVTLPELSTRAVGRG